jgi:hypothetical protein
MQALPAAALSPVQQIADDHQQLTTMQNQANTVQSAGIGLGALFVLFAVIVLAKNLIIGNTPAKKPKARAASA